MKPLTEARMLRQKIRNALDAIKFDEEAYKEGEVLFRLRSIEGMLIMALNDAEVMKKLWEKDEEESSTPIESGKAEGKEEGDET